MTMSDREKKAWSLAAKVLVVAIPAAISGIVSYAKSRLESKDETNAAYVTLKEAVQKLQNERDHDSMHIQYLAAEIEKCRNGSDAGTMVAVAPPVKTDGGGLTLVSGVLKSDGGIAFAPADGGAVVALRPRPPRLHDFTSDNANVEVMVDSPPRGPLPDTLDQAVQQMQMRRPKK